MACSYGVLEYAWDPYEAYTRQYGGGRALGRALVVGMNPGPWGMVSMCVCIVITYIADLVSIGMVANPARGQLNR